jgi:hypothetical protein
MSWSSQGERHEDSRTPVCEFRWPRVDFAGALVLYFRFCLACVAGLLAFGGSFGVMVSGLNSLSGGGEIPPIWRIPYMIAILGSVMVGIYVWLWVMIWE